MSNIYPVKDNGFYLTLVDEELKPIRCIRDYTHIFTKDEVYSYRLYKHDETSIDIYVVYVTPDTKDPNYFTRKSLSKHFDTTAILREEKLKSLGI